MKTKIFTLLFVLVLVPGTLSAQSSKYLHVSGQVGLVANSIEDRKLGVGGTVAFFLQDNLIAKSDQNFWSISVRGFNNPIRDGKIITSIMNKEVDAFNYIGLLAGYRVTSGDIQNGLFAEPRLGLAFTSGWHPAFVFSPTVGCAFEGFEVGFFGDLGLGGKNTIIGKKNFFTVGVTLGYNFAL